MNITLTRECSGGCGETITYSVASEITEPYDGRYVPEIRPTSGSCVAYAGGHLCDECWLIVEGALDPRQSREYPARRKWRAAGLRW